MKSFLVHIFAPISVHFTRNGLIMAPILTFCRIRYRRVLFCLSLFLLASILFVNLVVHFDKPAQLPAKDLSIPEGIEEDYNNLDLKPSFESFSSNSSIIARPWSLSQYRLQWSVNTKRFPIAKPWFMKNGTIKASQRYASRLAIWPEEVSGSNTDPNIDRIVNQLMFVPLNYNPNHYLPRGKLPLKKILLYFGKNGWGDLMLGRRKFLQDKCPVNTCFITDQTDQIESADAVIFKDRFMWPKKGKPLGQLWILFLLECPLHTQLFVSLGPNVFNWTASYRHDSDLVAPYEKFVSYQSILDETPSNQYNDLFESTVHHSLPTAVSIY